jgi:hypothetical protein
MKTSGRLFKAIEPVLVASFLARNLDSIGRNTISMLGGINFYLAKQARLGANLDLQLTSSPTNYRERSSAGSKGIVQLEIQW